MIVNDPIADMLTRIRNAQIARHDATVMPASNTKKAIAKILLDDFGSGFSSFGMLKRYNFDILKLDMTFTRQIETSPKVCTIINGIIQMVHHLGIKVIAEGAETEAQVKFLRENDCDYIQGYYFSKPLPEADFLAYVQKAAAEGKIGPSTK